LKERVRVVGRSYYRRKVRKLVKRNLLCNFK